ncbi:MAG: lysophospholipid acyltransferase family protein [Longimicrobiaceae bacterium]
MNGLRRALAVRAGGAAAFALLASCRFETAGEEHVATLRSGGRPFISVLWHGRMLPVMFRHRGEGMVGLASRNRDGEQVARLMESWGYGAERGSSSRGGAAAVRGLLRHLEGGRSVAVTPDGPRGPREVLKPGVVALARASGAPMLPVAAGASKAWWLGKWDRFLVPKPFARVRVAYGLPIDAPKLENGDESVQTLLSARLQALMEEVDAW